MRHLISPQDLSLEELEELLTLGQDIMNNQSKYAHVCDGKKLATLFYEPSTRTRLSFEAAMINMGGQVLGFSEASSSSASKGESVADTIRVISWLRRYLRNAPSKGGCPDRSCHALFHPGDQCRRRRTQSSDPDVNRSSDDQDRDRQT